MADTWKSYFNKLRVVNNQVVKQYSNEVKNVLKDNLRELWYNSHSPNSYIRTSELLESVSVTEVSRNGKYGAIATVYFDSSKLTHNRPNEGGWGQHMSMDGTPIGNILAYWIDQGNGASFYHYDGVNYVEATLKEVKQIAYNTQKKLNSMGYSVEIR